MFNSQVVKDRSGQHYIIRLRNQGHLNLSVKPERFHNTQISYQFVTSLQSPFGLWQNIAASNSFFSLQRWQNSNPSLTIEHYAAEVLVQGFVEVYKTLSPSQVNQNRSKNSFKDDAGRTLRLQPASSLLLTNSAEKKTIHNENEASQFIETLDLAPKELQELQSTLNLAAGAQGTGSHAANSQLVDALVSGEVVITIEHEHKPQKVTEYIEYADKRFLEPDARPDLIPKIINQAWSVYDCHITDEYKLTFDVKDFSGNESVTLSVYQYDELDNKQLVDEFLHHVSTKNGHIEVLWSALDEDVQTQEIADGVSDVFAPYDFTFTTKVKGETSDEVDPLFLRKTIEIQVENLPEDEQFEVILHTPDEQECKQPIEDGSVSFENILLGPITYEIEKIVANGNQAQQSSKANSNIAPEKENLKPEITNQAWSVNDCHISDEYKLTFDVKDFLGDESVTLSVYQYDELDNKQLVDEFVHKVTTKNGQVEVLWSALDEDVQTQEIADGVSDVFAPYDFTFTTNLTGNISNESEPLLLRKTIEIQVENLPENEQFEVILHTPDEQELKKPVVDGSVSFENILLGPITYEIENNVENVNEAEESEKAKA